MALTWQQLIDLLTGMDKEILAKNVSFVDGGAWTTIRLVQDLSSGELALQPTLIDEDGTEE